MEQNLDLYLAQMPTLCLMHTFASTVLLRTMSAIDARGCRKSLDDASKKNGFRSSEDMVLCASMPKYTKYCISYYEGRGLPLRDLRTERQLDALDYEISRRVPRMAIKILENTP